MFGRTEILCILLHFARSDSSRKTDLLSREAGTRPISTPCHHCDPRKNNCARLPQSEDLFCRLKFSSQSLQNGSRKISDPRLYCRRRKLNCECDKRNSVSTRLIRRRQAKLEANGTARKLAANHDLSHVRPLLDEDLRTAIRSLETSTSAIEKQTAQLKQQWQYLETHGHELGKLQALQKKTTEKLERNSTLEEQHVRIASEELIQDISAKLSSYQSGVQSRSKVAPTKISELLNHDDRILSKISKVATSLTPDDGSHEEASLRTDSLASTLAHFRTKTLQCRLDRLYLETLHEEFASRPAEEENLAETELQQKSLEEELDSLYPEIHDLASMSVEQEFKAPIMSTLAAQSRMRHEMSEGQRRYVCHTLITDVYMRPKCLTTKNNTRYWRPSQC